MYIVTYKCHFKLKISLEFYLLDQNTAVIINIEWLKHSHRDVCENYPWNYRKNKHKQTLAHSSPDIVNVQQMTFKLFI